MAPSLLVVDDDPLVLQVLGRGLRGAGYEVDTAAGGPAGLERLASKVFDALLVDICMPEVDGFQVMRHAVQHGRARVVFVVTGQSELPVAIEAMRAGARDFFTKPLDAEAIKAALARSLGDPATRETHDEKVLAWRDANAAEIVGSSPKLVDLLGLMQKIADTECNVLITGESGTGKELVARALHRSSRRAAQAFVAVNCAAIPKELMESEMFGHARGAFTGAADRRDGRFQLADRGTLFLDEIGELELGLQSKLLRVIQEGEFTPIGEARSRRADVRVIAATNQDLEALCQDGRFRADLFYRLNVLPVQVPTLRERGDDIEVLAQHFVARANARHERRVRGLDPAAAVALRRHRWPGNVRELANLLERLVILSRGDELTCADLPATIVGGSVDARLEQLSLPDDGFDMRAAMEKLEAKLMLDALRRADGNKAKAAELLGLKRTTLVERLKRLNIPETVFGD